MHSHGNDVAIAMNCVMEYGLSQRDTALHIAPLYHVGGMQSYFIPHVMVGATNVILGRYDALTTLETIQDERVTTLFAVPTQIQEMLFYPRFSELDVSSLRMITTGGSAMASATMERVIREFCPNIFNGYGMTEASLALLLHPEEALTHLGSCGKPTLITDGRIAALGLTIIEDDKNFFPIYNPALEVRKETYDEYGEQLDEVFGPIAEALDTKTMTQMNARVDVDGELPEDVAEDFLSENGFVE